MERLPLVLEHEPLIDAVFEIRFGDTQSLADILPGVLFARIDPKPTIVRLPQSAIPQAIRTAADPNFAYVPLVRLELEQFIIMVGDKSLGVACKMPYPKWPRFKDEILSITNLIADLGVVGSVERYSLKYVNMIHGGSIAEQLSKINISLMLGGVEVVSGGQLSAKAPDHVSLQVHQQELEVRHLMSIITSAKVGLLNGLSDEGTVVDIDSIRSVNTPSYHEFVTHLNENIESLRQDNKAKFFSCLTQAAIDEMGPTYE